MDHPAAHIDTAAVAALREERVDWRHKGMPPAFWGRTVAEVLDAEPRLSQLPTPVLSLSRVAMTRNRDVLAAWCAERGIGTDEVIAFGDMPNDVSMLAWAGHSFAMAGAHPDVVAVATDRAGASADDGVARAIEAILDLQATA